MKHKSAHEKRGLIIESEVKVVIDQWIDSRSEEELNREVAKKELKELELKLKRYNVQG